MILTAHQPVYLPWLGLFHKIALADIFISFNQVQYLLRDWNNRNKIKTPADDIWLTVPVLTKGYREKKIKEIEINNSINWRKKHWKSMLLAYKKAPFFNKYSDFLEDVYQREWKLLTELNEYMLKWFLDVLGIKVKFSDASEFRFSGEKSDLVLEMCKCLEADVYIFGEQGKDYANIELFKKKGIKIVFQEYNHPVYTQLHGNFISHVSILDLLFNCGEKSLETLMDGNLAKEDILSSKFI
ncbi:MAG: WbqC family protein [Candidatus Scalindua sp.]